MHDAFLALLYPLPYLATLSVLVFVHEMGHFLVARACQVQVASFSVGFGRELLGRTDRRGTRWKLCLLPFGGYVRLAGGEALYDKPVPWRVPGSFADKSLAVRAAVTIGGPLANFVFAVALVALVFATRGQHVFISEITAVQPGMPAAAAGMQVGDRFVSVDGEAVENMDDVTAIIRRHPGDTLTIVLRRGDALKTIQVVPQVVQVPDATGKLNYDVYIGYTHYGVGSFVRRSPGDAVIRAVGSVGDEIKTSLLGIRQLFQSKRPTDQLGGMASVVQASRSSLHAGPAQLMMMAAAMSIGLGFFNLFPIPLLDGGHLVFFAIEAVTRRPPTPRVVNFATRLGLGLLVMLALLGARNDLLHSHAAGFMHRQVF